jgi:hypothetical protein
VRQLRVVSDLSTPPAAGRLVGLREAADLGCTRDSREQLFWALLGPALQGDAAEQDEALALLLGHPALLVRLDARVREYWYLHRDRPEPAALLERFQQPGAGALVVALASLHRDGRIRQAAVSRMLNSPRADLVPFLALRTTDWVPQVRALARGGLAVLLHEQPALVPEALGVALRMEHRSRGDFLGSTILAALLGATPRIRARLLAAPDPRVRSYLGRHALAHGWFGPDELLSRALGEPDRALREAAAEQAAKQAIWQNRLPVLEHLAASRHPGVRVTGLTALARAGQPVRAAGYLDDPAAVVRALARDVVRRAGGAPRTHYRAAVGLADPPLGAVEGLGETGTAQDAPLLAPLLGHRSAQVRAAAVRGLARIGALHPEQALRMLHDPSPRVVREAAVAAAAVIPAVDAVDCRALLADQRIELRRAGYRLLRHGTRPIAVRREAAELARTDPDPRLARLAAADAARLSPAGPRRR